jgi:hypothetical protein
MRLSDIALPPKGADPRQDSVGDDGFTLCQGKSLAYLVFHYSESLRIGGLTTFSQQFYHHITIASSNLNTCVDNYSSEDKTGTEQSRIVRPTKKRLST